MRYALFHFLMRIKQPFMESARRKRMAEFMRRMQVSGGERIIDLGGTPGFWADAPVSLDLTIVNLPGFNPSEPGPSHHRITLLDGDACDLAAFADQSFDIAFSNSVIEHVGDLERRQSMAGEVRRLAPAYWVQTPAIWFPIEAHTMMPFWWFYPGWLQRALIRHWRRKLPAWTEMVETTTIVSRGEMQRSFPDAALWAEWKLGFPKSYVAYKRGAGMEQTAEGGA
ncbi:MAG: class I SAM-dependent methyltransferase [Rhodobacteraceae bacterium]|nr:class I SAM-dependent methyltransferase [Paracoccaceae bacterium]